MKSAYEYTIWHCDRCDNKESTLVQGVPNEEVAHKEGSKLQFCTNYEVKENVEWASS